MNDIPHEVYERVHQLALDLTNARLAEDDVLGEVHFQALLAYHRELADSGHPHPFVTETLADHTEDPTEAVRLYQLAIAQSSAFPNEPIHTKQIDLGQRLIEAGNTEHAEAYLREARARAVCCNDPEAIEEADGLLQEIA